MKISPAGLKLIEQFECCKLRSYPDQNGVWTIGWGHTGGVAEGAYETQAQADADLCHDAESAEGWVTRLVHVPLAQGQFDALVSFTYNEGPGRLARSTILRELNEAHYTAAAAHFRDWEIIAGKHSDGLARRREAEIALFNGTWQPPVEIRAA